jgi:O-antigen ligase
MTPSPGERGARIEKWRERVTLAIVLGGAIAVPLVFRRDPFDMFRLPKAMLLRGEAILLVAVTLGASILGAPLPRFKWRDPWLALPLAAIALMAILSLTSTNRMLSLGVLGSAAATLIVYYATVASAHRASALLFVVPLTAAVINALLVVVEEANLWMPFGVQPGVAHHLQCDALIGNPNEIGGYLGAALLAALAMRGRVRIAVAAILGIALVACQTLTAMIACTLAALAMLALRSWKTALRAGAAGVVTALLVVALVAPLRARAMNVVTWARTGDYNAIVSERFTSFVAAWTMFTDHPLTGVGPGAFAWQYYDYKIRAEGEHPSLRAAFNRGVNFGEVHNDHLQALAEGGVVGYAAFVTLLAALAMLSFRRGGFVRRLALPLAVFWLVLSIAQFPLESTVVRMLLVHFAALCVGWRRT